MTILLPDDDDDDYYYYTFSIVYVICIIRNLDASGF